MGQRVRHKLAVGDPAGRRSSIWLVWFGRSDIYVAVKTLAGTWKFTVHYPRPPRFTDAIRYFGYTSEYTKKLSPGRAVNRRERTRIESSFLPITPDLWLECVVRIPEAELREWPSDTSEVTWLPTPTSGHMVELLVVSAPADYDVKRFFRGPNAPAVVVEESLAQCGRRACVLHREVQTYAGELEDVRLKLKKAWPVLTRPGLSGKGTRAAFFGKVNDTIGAMYEVAADAL